MVCQKFFPLITSPPPEGGKKKPFGNRDNFNGHHADNAIAHVPNLGSLEKRRC